MLELCRAAAGEEPAAALALARWSAWQEPVGDRLSKRERRFRRRAYTRAREDAMPALVMRVRAGAASGRTQDLPEDRAPRAPTLRPTTRLGVLLRQHQAQGGCG